MDTTAAVIQALWQTINDDLQSSPMNRNQPTTANTTTMNPLLTMAIPFEWEVYRYVEAHVAKLDREILIECAAILIDQNWEGNIKTRLEKVLRCQSDHEQEQGFPEGMSEWEKMLKRSSTVMDVDEAQLVSELLAIQSQITRGKCALKEKHEELIRGRALLGQMKHKWNYNGVIGRGDNSYETLFPQAIPNNLGLFDRDILDTNMSPDTADLGNVKLPESSNDQLPSNEMSIDDWVNELIRSSSVNK